MKLQLVKAPTLNTGMPEHDWYTPLNLIWLANYVGDHGYSVEILDGQLLGLDEILDRLDAAVVGVSFDILSIAAFDAIVREAKRRGCFTVAGGHLATALWSELLRSNLDLDAVVRFDGEEALLRLLRSLEGGQQIDDKIPNLAYRLNGEIFSGHIEEVDLCNLPLPRRHVGGINLEHYIGNYQATKRRLSLTFPHERPTNTYSHKGCPFRSNGGGCSFCSRVDPRFRRKTGDQVYEEYRYLAEELGVDYISDFSDSWISLPFVRELAEKYEREGPVAARLRVYGDVRLINQEVADFLRRLQVDTVLLGIESGNEEILRLNGKPVTLEQTLAAVRTLARHGIKVADAYVLGLIGETQGTVRDTVALARQIRELCHTEISYWNIMTPLPGSRVWRILFPEGVPPQFTGCRDYHLDAEKLEQLAVERLCRLGPNGYDFLTTTREEMIRQSPLASAEFVKVRKIPEIQGGYKSAKS